MVTTAEGAQALLPKTPEGTGKGLCTCDQGLHEVQRQSIWREKLLPTFYHLHCLDELSPIAVRQANLVCRAARHLFMNDGLLPVVVQKATMRLLISVRDCPSMDIGTVILRADKAVHRKVVVIWQTVRSTKNRLIIK